MSNIILKYLIDKCKNDNKIVLSNIDLENIFKLITNQEINISSDKLLTCGIDNLNKYSIFNLDWNTGTHWVAMYVDNTNKLVNFFDSFGNSLPEKFIIRKSYIVTHNNYKFQNSNDVNCGWWSLLFLYVCYLTSKIKHL